MFQQSSLPTFLHFARVGAAHQPHVANLQPKQQYKQQPKQQTMQQLVHELIKTTVQKVSAYAATQLVKVEMGDNDNQMADKTGKKNIVSLETTRRQLRCESSKNYRFHEEFLMLKP